MFGDTSKSDDNSSSRAFFICITFKLIPDVYGERDVGKERNRIMGNVEKYQLIVDKIGELTNGLLIDAAQKECEAKLSDFCKELEESRYIKVPLVGVFSAGKSSLLNVFTQKPEMLPIDTLPETAVAYELYYGTPERVELYRDGKLIEDSSLINIKDLRTTPGDIAKVYCNSEPVKQLQDRGIILVDMPGIGSGIERHDAAIINYINTGTAFILLVDAEQGSLRGSTMTFLSELSKYDLNPAVLVSKIDKKPEEEVKEIVEYIQYQMERAGINNPYVSTVCAVNNDLAGLKNYLDVLDADELLAKRVGNQLKLIIASIISQLKVRIDLRSKEISNVDEKVKQIENEIANVRNDLPLESSEADTPEKSTDDILENIGKAIDENTEEIAQMIVNHSDSEEIKEKIISIIRSELILSLKDESQQYSAAIGGSVQDSLKDLATLDIDSNFLEDYEGIIDVLKLALVQLVGKLGGAMGKVLAVVVSQLDKILNWMFGKTNEDKKAEVVSIIMEKTKPSIIEHLRPNVLKIVAENQMKIRTRIQSELVSKMERVKEGLQEKIADEKKNKTVVENEINILRNAITELESLNETV